jgi:hypothetical protein
LKLENSQKGNIIFTLAGGLVVSGTEENNTLPFSMDVIKGD